MTEPMPMPPPEKKQEVAETKPHKSKGERFFDRAVYGGIAGVGTFVATVILTDALKDGRLSWFNRGATKLFKKGADLVARNRDNSEFASDAAITTSLMMGGNLMLIPVGIAEHHKVALVDGLNAAMEDKTPKETIQNAPKQTWMSLLKSRGLAWVAVFTTLKGLSAVYKETMQSFEHQTGEFACRIMNKPTHRGPADAIASLQQQIRDLRALPVSKEVGADLKKTAAELEKFETRTYRYGKIGAIDLFATIGAATLLYMGGHFFARKQEEKKEHKLERKLARVGGASPDLVEDAEILKLDTPAAQVVGAKIHDGMARVPVALGQQV